MIGKQDTIARIAPGETPEGVLNEITSLPALKGVNFKAKIAQSDHVTYTGETLTANKFFPAWELNEDDEFLQKALKGLVALCKYRVNHRVTV